MGTHGGARPGAGRKSDAEVKRMSELLKDCFTQRDWQNLMRALMRKACRGNAQAAQLLLRYGFGNPDKAQEDPRYLSVIRIIDPDDPTTDPLYVEEHERLRKEAEEAQAKVVAESAAEPAVPARPRRVARGIRANI